MSRVTLTLADVEEQTARRLDALACELADRVGVAAVKVSGRRHLDRLLERATVLEFIPLLVDRSVREELIYVGHAHRDAA